MTMCALNKVKGMKIIMKNEYFNIGDADYSYDNIDRLNAKDLENLNGDNLFLAFLKENNQYESIFYNIGDGISISRKRG